VYEALSDECAEPVEFLRIIDESGDDYLYPSFYFVFVVLPQQAKEALQSAG